MKYAIVPAIHRQFLKYYGSTMELGVNFTGQHFPAKATELLPDDFFASLLELGVLTDTVYLRNELSEVEWKEHLSGCYYPFLCFRKEGDEVVPVMVTPHEKGHRSIFYFSDVQPGKVSLKATDEFSFTPVTLSPGKDAAYCTVITCFPVARLQDRDTASEGEAEPASLPKFTILSKFFRLIMQDRKEIMYLLLYAVFVGIISLSLPLGVQSLIGFISSGQVVTSVIVLISFILLGVLLSGIMTIMQLQLVEHIHQRMFARTAFAFAFRVPRIRIESVLKYYPPELMNRFFDTLTFMKGMSVLLIDFSAAILQTVFGILLLSMYHPLFIVVGSILVLVLVIILRITGPLGLKTALKESAFKYMTANWLEEIARSLSTFKLAGNTNFAMQKTDYYVSNYIAAREEHFKVLRSQYYSFVIFKTVITALLLILGAILITERQINLGQFVAAEIVIILIMNAIEKIILKLDSVYDVLVSVEKITDVTSLPVEMYKGIDLPVKPGEGIAVSLKNVDYRFPDRKEQVLRNVNLNVEKGDRVCISGFNGSGKTTIAHLVIGLYENYDGIISYNGVSLRDINKASLMNHLGDYVSQEGLFDGTIYENIVIGRTQCNLEDLQWAIAAAGLSDFVHELPEGLNTRLIGGTVRISESMARKIVIARNLVEKPGLLVLDDFLLGVERKEKKRIMELLLSAEFNWTMMVISNDPMIMDMMNTVVLMRDGSIVDQGSFRKIAAENKDLQELIKDYPLT
jgi:ABC-type bacteriocin/lantibiotic exporter with double-glycine peptidase domain